MRSQATAGKKPAARLTVGMKLVPGQVTKITYDLRNLGNSPIANPVLAMPTVQWMLRSIQPGLWPRAIN